MRKKIIEFGIYVALTGFLLTAYAAVDADFMQVLEDTQKSLTSNISLKNAKSASADAKEMEVMFTEVEAFFAKKGNAADAVTWSQESKALASGVAQALAANDFDGASQKAVTLAKTCKACHKIYKTKD
jgi:cytochrome c556